MTLISALMIQIKFIKTVIMGISVSPVGCADLNITVVKLIVYSKSNILTLAKLHYLSWFLWGLCEQPEPIEEEPHHLHLFPPGPCICFFVGLWGQPEPYDVEPQKTHFFSSPICSCFLCGLRAHPEPNELELQYLHLVLIFTS